MAGVSIEHELLEKYFAYISQFTYDKAKELCDKEKESHKTSCPSPGWSLMVSVLSQLAVAEKTYSSLLFLGKKWFGSKDNLRSSYGLLITELRKVDELTRQPTVASDLFIEPADLLAAGTELTVVRSDGAAGKSEQRTSGSRDEMFETLIGHLSGQIVQFMMARVKATEFYEQMATMGSNRNMNYEDLLHVIMEICDAHQKGFHHPILSPLKYSFSFECEVIQHLLTSQLHMQHWRFLDSLLNLNEAHGKLVAWAALIPAKESKLGFGSSKSQNVSALYQWLVKYKCTLVAKFGLYFHEVLSKQVSAGELKTILAKTSMDFYTKIVTFQRKSDAAFVSLVFDSTGEQDMQKGIGYQHPKKFTDPPTGLDSFPAIFTYPGDKPDKHWPEVVSIITDQSADLGAVDKNIYFYDERQQVTYFLSRIEPTITLAVIFESKKAEKDSYVNNFLIDITAQLRCTKIFSALRPGSKG